LKTYFSDMEQTRSGRAWGGSPAYATIEPLHEGTGS
jgi:hypothetical protein